MKFLNKIELLPVYLTSIALLLLSLNLSGLISLDTFNVKESHVDIDFYDNVSYSENGEISVLNPDLEIYTSLDGGESFGPSGNSIDLAEYRNENIINYPSSWRWYVPHWDQKECPSLNLILYNEKKDIRSQEVFEVQSNKSNLDQVSISIPESQFVGYQEGINVLGHHGDNIDGFSEAWFYRDANFRQRGAEWEKSSFVSLQEDGKTVFNQKCGIKISGNATRGFGQKSFKLYARKNYGSEQFKGEVFEGQNEATSFVLRSSGNDNTKTLFADLLMNQLAEGSKVKIQKGKRVEVFINGNYWGIYNLRERISIYNLALEFEEKYEKITLLENGAAELKDGLIEEHTAFHEMLNSIESKEMLSDQDVKSLKDEIHFKSFIDYIFFQTYYGNNDWPHNNTICYKVKNKPWKWMLNDLDYSLAYPGDENVNYNVFEHLKSGDTYLGTIFCGLMTNEKFKEKFVQRCEELLESNLSDSRINKVYTDNKNELEEHVDAHINRWRIFTKSEWNENCQKNLDFLLTRKSIYREQLNKL